MTVADRTVPRLLAPVIACALLLAGGAATTEAKVTATVGGKILTVRAASGPTGSRSPAVPRAR